MDEITVSMFRLAVQTLTRPTQVTLNRRVIGTWYPGEAGVQPLRQTVPLDEERVVDTETGEIRETRQARTKRPDVNKLLTSRA